MKINKKNIIILLAVLVVIAGYLFIQSRSSSNNAGNIGNNVNVSNSAENYANTGGNNNAVNNTADPASNNSSGNAANTASDNSGNNTENISGNTGKNTGSNEPGKNTSDNSGSNQNAGNNTSPSGAKYYVSSDLEDLKGTEIFNSTAIEHIFIGSVNSKGNGSGYHYSMISDAKGKIVEGSESALDKNGLYTAKVEVDGHPKNGFSTFFPDKWSPQQVVDAIAAAREDALKTGKMSGDYHVGYYKGIQINLYLDKKDRVVTAFPIYDKGK